MRLTMLHTIVLLECCVCLFIIVVAVILSS
jgi:hypothetical protein